MKLATTTLVCCVAALLALGMVMLYSSGMVQFGAHYFQMQFVWCGLGLAVGAVLMVNDYRALKKYAVALLVLSVVMLVLVLIPGIGLKVGGARRWFRIGEVRFQPSEVAKISLLIFVAWYADRYQRLMPTFWRGLARPGLVIGLVLGLIFVEPDRGSCILLASVSGIMPPEPSASLACQAW